MKRFYKLVSVSKNEGQYAVLLDGRPINTPSGAVLLSPCETLAEAIMAEWMAQKEDILPDTMPLTQILTTAIESASKNKEEIKKSVLAYLHTDLLCYRAGAPSPVAQRQADAWNPWLRWFKDEFGVELLTTESLQALKQDPKAVELIDAYLESLDIYLFTLLQILVSECGSLVLGLAFIKGKASPDDLFHASNVEENYRAEVYNEDLHGRAPLQEAREASMIQTIEAAKKFLIYVEHNEKAHD